MVWGVSAELLAEKHFFFLRMVISLVLCLCGIAILVGSWFASYQVASAFPDKSISELPIPQLVYNAALPAGIGVALFFFGLISRFVSKGALPWFVVALLVWAFGGYNLYQIGMFRPQASFSEYLNQTVVFILLGLVIFGVGVLSSWHGEVKSLIAEYGARAAKRTEAKREEARKPEQKKSELEEEELTPEERARLRSAHVREERKPSR